MAVVVTTLMGMVSSDGKMTALSDLDVGGGGDGAGN